MSNSSVAKPWSLYKTGVPFSYSCAALETVSHVCHLPVAARVLEDGHLRADLVYDYSILREDRIRVVWMSPNHWTAGYRYGNVSFTYDWQALCKGKNFYWVEAIKHNPDACRILITSEDRGSDKRLIPFDPLDRDGPWIREPMGADFWNTNYTLEFMIEGDISLDLCKKLDFVNHHEFQCCIDPKTCRDRNQSGDKAAAILLGRLASRYFEIKTPGLLETDSGKIRASLNVCAAAGKWVRTCSKFKPTTWGSVEATDPSAPILARAILNAFTNALPEEAKTLMSMFKALDDVHLSVRQVIAQTIGLSDPSGLDP